jgi:hypothetical protein
VGVVATDLPKMRQQPVDHRDLLDHRHHPHLDLTPRTQQRIHLEDPPQKTCPAPAPQGRGAHLDFRWRLSGKCTPSARRCPISCESPGGRVGIHPRNDDGSSCGTASCGTSRPRRLLPLSPRPVRRPAVVQGHVLPRIANLRARPTDHLHRVELHPHRARLGVRACGRAPGRRTRGGSSHGERSASARRSPRGTSSWDRGRGEGPPAVVLDVSHGPGPLPVRGHARSSRHNSRLQSRNTNFLAS